jgi:hypothetical protein
MAFVNKNKAKVGDYVKVIKKLPYKDQMDVDIGDIGVVNYVASTGKYSVHIDGKKNPHDDTLQRARTYGKKYDFWIPFECCEVVDSEELIKKCLFENADVLDDCKITVDTNSISFKSNKCLNSIKFSNSVSTTTASTCTYTIKDTITDYFTEKKEREENKMKEIKNQKVVDLYFKRKEKALEDEFDAIREKVKEADANYIFIKQYNDQINEYIKTNEIKDLCINVELPLTEESVAKRNEAYDDYRKKLEELNNIKEEITALSVAKKLAAGGAFLLITLKDYLRRKRFNI